MAGRQEPREKGRSASPHNGAGLCTTPMPQPLMQPSHAPPTKPLAQPNSLAVTKEARHGREACCGRSNPREKGRSASAQDGAGQCSTPICHNPSGNPRMHCQQNILHNRTHKLRRRKHAMGGPHVDGRHNPEEKRRLAMGGGILMHYAYAIIPSRNPRMHCRKTPFVQPYSQAATKEP